MCAVGIKWEELSWRTILLNIHANIIFWIMFYGLKRNSEHYVGNSKSIQLGLRIILGPFLSNPSPNKRVQILTQTGHNQVLVTIILE